VWLTRLGTFLYVRIAKDGKDGRFDDIKKSWLTFLGAWTIQALWVLLIQAPVLLINDADDRAPASVVDVVAAACWVVGFGVEFMADVQKFAFRADPVRNSHAS
jgi:steroid 5-alpha reductase family enzyme